MYILLVTDSFSQLYMTCNTHLQAEQSSNVFSGLTFRMFCYMNESILRNAYTQSTF